MKRYKKIVVVKISPKISFIFLFLLVFMSCRKEEFRFEEAPEEASLIKTSMVANLIQRTALNDGSGDNIIDLANCISVILPIDLEANGILLTINNPDDYETIEAIFDESDSDTDTLIIFYPISILLDDHTEVTINNENEFNNYRDNCSGENEDDDDIECIDFNFPITLTTYNTITEVLDSKTINNDKDFYEFIDDIEDHIIVNINFPIELTLFDGTILTINSLDDLEDEIEDVIDDCDEDDDFDFDDDDNISGSEQELIDLLVQCPWEIHELEINDEHNEDQFNGYKFEFNSNGTTTATNSTGTVFNGTWEVTTNSGLRVTIQFDDFSIISNVWRVHEINPEDDGTRIDLRNLEDELKLRQVCP